MSEDIVFFLAPDGRKVSNDPRWLQDNAAKALEEQLAATPNRGNMGITKEEQDAQTGHGVKAPQSGQPGVGEAAVEDDPEEYGSEQISGRVIQNQDVQLALDLGNTGNDPARAPKPPVDSNKKVAEVRDAQAKREEAAAKAQEALVDADQEPGDPDVPYSEWTAKQLKAEALTRNASRGDDDQIDLSGVKTKSQLAERLEADDNRN